VTDLPFDDGAFDVVLSQHVQMNIEDKAGLYRETRRVLREGGRLALWDVLAGTGGPVLFPVPWADDAASSWLVTPDELRRVLADAGFAIVEWQDRTAAAGSVLPLLLAQGEQPLGLHVFVPEFRTKLRNFATNAEQDRICLVQAIVEAR
jgi:SAM-dependent methyltransferase